MNDAKMVGITESNTVANKANRVSTNGLKTATDEHNYSYADEGFCFVYLF